MEGQKLLWTECEHHIMKFNKGQTNKPQMVMKIE